MAQRNSSVVDIEDRLAFMSLDAASMARLRKLKPIIDRELPRALDKFYARVRTTPEVRKFFRDDAHMAGARNAQLRHWDAISSGRLDASFAENVGRIGVTHARIGLEPRWYMGGYAILLEHLIEAVIANRGAGGMSRLIGGGSAKEVGAMVSALVKAVLVEMEIAISTYIHGTEEKERRVVNDSIGSCLEQLADQDVTCRLSDNLPSAYDELRNNFNSAMGELDQALLSVRESISTIDNAAQEITAASDDLSRRTESQAATLEETTAALSEITTTIKSTAENASQARDLAGTAEVEAEKSGAVVRDAVDAMQGIKNASKEINQIIGVIDEIAFQTNLLALNAGVEAARAGEAGRGFAVVASEVRSLALRSAEASKQIRGLISTSTVQVDRGVDLVGKAGAALEAIIAIVSKINAEIENIAQSASEQASGVGEVNTAVGQMDQMTQQNAAMVEETTAATKMLAGQTRELAELVKRFKTSETDTSVRPVRTSLQHETSAARSNGAYTNSASGSSHSNGAAAYMATRQGTSQTQTAGDWEDF